MCTLSIFTRIVRWRVKDFASCFLASRFPLAAAEEEAAETNPKETIVLDRKEKDESGGKEINMPLPTTLSTNIVSVDKESDYSSRPCFSDEDYIVFCFKEDGAFILMEDGNKSEESMVNSDSFIFQLT
ncbi:hypothetical protein V6N12_033638 [Hibiscus sabdariffa]|uniref:Uncharacterized protein n=1 Tax=Hibiscus sabdariffa TaxID=183260 RepID=A0ABR2BW96_9ROSI